MRPKAYVNYLSCGIRISAELSFVLSQFKLWQTDRQTDRRTPLRWERPAAYCSAVKTYHASSSMRFCAQRYSQPAWTAFGNWNKDSLNQRTEIQQTVTDLLTINLPVQYSVSRCLHHCSYNDTYTLQLHTLVVYVLYLHVFLSEVIITVWWQYLTTHVTDITHTMWKTLHRWWQMIFAVIYTRCTVCRRFFAVATNSILTAIQPTCFPAVN